MKENETIYLSEIGDVNNDDTWKNIFEGKNFNDMENFISILPGKSPNHLVQNMIFNFLTTRKVIDKDSVTLDQDKKANFFS